MSTKTLYEFLGIEPEATPEEIKTAAQSLINKFHPSKFPGNQQVIARAKKIKQVYNILGNPQKRAAYDAILAKKMAEMAPAPSPKAQKRSLLARQKRTVAKKQGKTVKSPVKAVPKASKPLKKTPEKTLAKDEENITQTQPLTEEKTSRPNHGLNYFLSLFFISLSTYFLFIEPSHLRKMVYQVEFLQGQLACINIGLQAILGLSLFVLLYSVFQQLRQRIKAYREQSNQANPKPEKTSTPAIEHNKTEAIASKPSTKRPQKTQAKPSKPLTTTTADTQPPEKEKQSSHIHWLKHIIGLLLIVIPVYLAFDPRILRYSLLQSQFLQDNISYLNWTLQGFFLVGCLIWLHTVFIKLFHLFRKKVPADNKQNHETPNIKKSQPQDNKEIKPDKAQKSTERQAEKKPFSHKYYGLGYLIALLLMAMPAYFLFIDPKFLKRLFVQFEFLQDRLFYITLSFQTLLVLSVLIFVITFFQHWRAILKKKALKKLEAADTMPAVPEESKDNKTLAKTSVKKAETKPQEQAAANRSKVLAESATRTPGSSKQAAHQKRPVASQAKPANEALTQTASPDQPGATSLSQQRPQANQQRPETANQTTANLYQQALEKIEQRKKGETLEKQTAVPENPKSAKLTASKRQTTVPSPKSKKSEEALDLIKNPKTLGTESHQEESQILAEKILYRADIHGIGAFKSILFIGLLSYLLLIDPAFLRQYLSQVDFLQEQLQYVKLTLLVMIGVGVFMLLHALWQQFTTTLMITSQRIVSRFGLFSRKQVEITHDQFEQIKVKQGLLGYLLGFGTLKIRGTKGKNVGGLKIKVSHVASPKQFEKRLMRIIKNSAYHQI